MKYVIMVLYMSEKLDCTYDYSQILNLFEKSELKESLSDNEVKQVNEYTLRLTYLESYANANNDKDIKEVAGFFKTLHEWEIREKAMNSFDLKSNGKGASFYLIRNNL